MAEEGVESTAPPRTTPSESVFSTRPWLLGALPCPPKASSTQSSVADDVGIHDIELTWPREDMCKAPGCGLSMGKCDSS